MGARLRRLRRAVQVGSVARHGHILRVLREIGVAGDRPATAEGARELRLELEELGTAYIKLGQLLSSRSDLLPDVYIEELGKLVDDVPPVRYEEIRAIVDADLGPDVFVRVGLGRDRAPHDLEDRAHPRRALNGGARSPRLLSG